MSIPFDYFDSCSHAAPDSCRQCDGTAADDREARRMTPADKARIAAEQARMAPLVAAVWAMPIEEVRALAGRMQEAS